MIITEKEKQIKNQDDIVEIMQAILKAEHETDVMKEHLWVIGMNNKNIIQYIELVSLGNLTSSVVSPREVFRFAISKAVASIILCHNHPAGDPAPSGEDANVTKRLLECGDILGIRVLDHIILGRDTHYSFRESSAIYFGRLEI